MWGNIPGKKTKEVPRKIVLFLELFNLVDFLYISSVSVTFMYLTLADVWGNIRGEK
jgi:hypothetical protein